MPVMQVAIGVDEVGRGCLAGPLVAVAVVLPRRHKLTGLKDSKLLSSAKRQSLARHIRRQALAIGIGWASNQQIDRLGLTLATSACMSEAVNALAKWRSQPIIVDGKYNYLQELGLDCQAIIKADQIYPAVMAASVVAKVARDSYMRQMADLWPDYGFEKHVGYGTQFHQQCLRAHGPSILHRLSFKPLASS